MQPWLLHNRMQPKISANVRIFRDGSTDAPGGVQAKEGGMNVSRQALVISLALIALTGTAGAQPMAGKFAIIPQIGLNVPLGDFGSTSETNENAAFAKIGYCAGGAIEYYAIESLAIGGAVYYNRFGLDTTAIANSRGTRSTFTLQAKCSCNVQVYQTRLGPSLPRRGRDKFMCLEA